LLVFAKDPLPPPKMGESSQDLTSEAETDGLACACGFYSFSNFVIVSRDKFDCKIQQLCLRVSVFLIHPHCLLKPFELFD
jgi:hypothetical protein